jgi:restriction system protein
MDAYVFQDLVAALLRGMGYHVSWVAPPGADGGLDIIAQGDPLGVKGPRIKGQVKRRKEKAGVEDIRSFISLLGNHDVGVFVALAGFSREAEAIVRAQEARRATLINLSALLALWTEHHAAIDEADRQLLPLTPVYYLSGTTTS